jgi:hypothetical protein
MTDFVVYLRPRLSCNWATVPVSLIHTFSPLHNLGVRDKLHSLMHNSAKNDKGVSWIYILTMVGTFQEAKHIIF